MSSNENGDCSGPAPKKSRDSNCDNSAKVFNDGVHGTITLPKVAVEIMDTLQFQRLQFITQLTSWLLYRSANHTRFEHSLGTAYLASTFAKALQDQEPDLVSDKDVVCVTIAGLCHDLGHGPFSHTWETFVREAEPTSNWEHEDASIEMLDFLLEENNLKSRLKELEDIDDNDIMFIKEMIHGPLDKSNKGQDWPYKGRSEEKSFLYEIISNKTNGIDVDKMDYLIRDNCHQNIGGTFDYRRYFTFAKIKFGENGLRTICMRDKERDNVYSIYADRTKYHKKGYQHRVTKIVDRMIVDALLEADKADIMKVTGTDGKLYRLSQACNDIVAYMKLNNDIFTKILYSDHADLENARGIVKRLVTHRFYKTIASLDLEKASNTDDMFAKAKKDFGKNSSIVSLRSRVKNKPEKVRVTYYDKEDKIVPYKVNDAVALSELDFDVMYIVCKSEDEAVLEAATREVDAWIEKNGLSQCRI